MTFKITIYFDVPSMLPLTITFTESARCNQAYMIIADNLGTPGNCNIKGADGEAISINCERIVYITK